MTANDSSSHAQVRANGSREEGFAFIDTVKLFRKKFPRPQVDDAVMSGVSYITPPPLRPSLHMIVLFAQDTRVQNYAKQCLQCLLDSGIDAYYQNTVADGAFIKHTNLVKIIAESHTDFLCVVGDKNHKNLTISARIDEKLSEITLEAFVAHINHHWSLRAGALDEASLTDRDLTEMTQTALASHIQQFLDVRFFLGKWKQFYRDSQEMRRLPAFREGVDPFNDPQRGEFLKNALAHAVSIHRDVRHGLDVMDTLQTSARNIWDTSGRDRGTALRSAASPTPDGGPMVSAFFKQRVGQFLEFVLSLIAQLVTTEAVRVAGPSNPWALYIHETCPAPPPPPPTHAMSDAGMAHNWVDGAASERHWAMSETGHPVGFEPEPRAFSRVFSAMTVDRDALSPGLAIHLPPIPANIATDDFAMQTHIRQWTDAMDRVLHDMPSLGYPLASLFQAYTAKLVELTQGARPPPQPLPTQASMMRVSEYAPMRPSSPSEASHGRPAPGFGDVLPDPPNLHHWID